MLRGALVAGAGLSAAALIGCGGDEETPSASTSGSTGTSTSSGGGPAAGVAPSGGGSGSKSGEPRQGGTYVQGTVVDLNEHDMNTARGGTVWHFIGERAFELNHMDGSLETSLVGSYEVVDDQATEFVLTLNQGINLHDKAPWNGREFNAEDLAFNLNRIVGKTAEEEGIPKGAFQRASMLPGFNNAEAIDDYSVRVTLDVPGGSFLNGLAEIRNQMMPQGIVEVGFDDPLKFAGMSAYEITEREAGVSTKFKRFDNYWRGKPGNFDALELLVLPDRAANIAAFVDGQIHYFAGPQPHERDQIMATVPDAQHTSWQGPHWEHHRFSHDVGMFDDFRVRKAFQLAIPYKERNDAIHGEGGWSWMVVGHPGFPESWTQEVVQTKPGYNPATKEKDTAEAVRLMEAAGHGNGAGLSFGVLYAPTAVTHEQQSLRWQNETLELWPEIDMRMTPAQDSAAFSNLQASRNFEVISYVITAVPDLYLDLYSQHHTDGSRNYGNWSFPEGDALINKGLTTISVEERTEIADEFQQKYLDEWMPMIVLTPRNEQYIVAPNFGGFDMTAGPWGFGGYMMRNDAYKWWFTE